MEPGQQAIITEEGLQALLNALRQRGYRVVGPTLRDQAIVYDDIAFVGDLPRGWSDEQDSGRYRLVKHAGDALFGYAVGPHSWKKFLHPPVQRLWRAEHRDGETIVVPEPDPDIPFAFLGVRACELHAISIQDRVFLGGTHADTHYQARRKDAFLVAVNCSHAGGTCFCVSMKTGPKADAGFDLALTEIRDDVHLFLVEVGTDVGGAVLPSCRTEPRHARRSQAPRPSSPAPHDRWAARCAQTTSMDFSCETWSIRAGTT